MCRAPFSMIMAVRDFRDQSQRSSEGLSESKLTPRFVAGWILCALVPLCSYAGSDSNSDQKTLLCLITTAAILLLCGLALQQHNQDSSPHTGPSKTRQEKRANAATQAPIALSGVLGQGQGSTVYKGYHNGQDVAAKIVSCADASRGDLWAVHTTDQLKHPNLVQVYSVRKVVDGSPTAAALAVEEDIGGGIVRFGDGKADNRFTATENGCNTCIITERCRLGNLRSAIRRGWFCRRGQFNNPKMLHVAALAHQVALALQYLHSRGIVHGNLQRSNVLLHKRGSLRVKGDVTVKVALSALSHREGRRPCRPDLDALPLASLLHVAPEVLQGGPTSKESDVYSFGVLLWGVLTGREASSETPRGDLVAFVSEGNRPKVPAWCPRGCAALIESCWRQDRRKRPGFDAIVTRLAEMVSEVLALRTAHGDGPAARPAASCTGVRGLPGSFFDTAHDLGELPLALAAVDMATPGERA